MRFVILTLGVLAAGCAGQSGRQTTVIATASQAAPASFAKTSDGKVDANAIANAKKLGYTVVNQDGQTLYCRREAKTGSRTEIETVCMTAKEIESLREQSQRNLGNITHQLPPAAGH